MAAIRDVERSITRVESVLVLLSIAAIASADYVVGRQVSIGYLYLIPLGYSALTHKWPVLLALVVLCVSLREWLGPIEHATWTEIGRDWLLAMLFLGIVASLHRLGAARAAFFETARKQRDELMREVELAAEVQRHLLDQHQPPAGMLDVVARMHPAMVVGGDYYDFIPLDARRFGVVVADISGKGLPAALIMPAVKIAQRTLATGDRPIADALDRLNQIFLDNLPSNSYFTLFYGVFDVEASRLTWANAAHLPGLHVEARSGAISWLDSTGGAVGLLPGTTYETRELAFAPGDVFVFYTDGITEAHGPADEEFGGERLAAVARERRGQPAAAIVAAVHDAVAAFRADGAPTDDATVIVVRVPERRQNVHQDGRS